MSEVPATNKKPRNVAPVDLWQYEDQCAIDGFTRIAGIDEAGRGPLAGPVVAACVVLSKSFETNGVNDSKKLTAKQRDIAFDRIVKEALAFGVGIVGVGEIDRINILRASYVAMVQAMKQVDPAPDIVLVDGLRVAILPCKHQRAIVKGDSASVSIAAASILAKVTRDRLMCELDALFPQYGFARHKGYSCPEHMAALTTHGPCPHHRRSFAPVANLLTLDL